MTFLQLCVLAVIQGVCELLPVSSSAHVVVAEKLMGLDPTRPEMTLLLVMLHTGTMFAVLFYFMDEWRREFFSSAPVFKDSAKVVLAATATTAVVGLSLKLLVEKIFLRGAPRAEIEMVFGNLVLVSASLAAVGALILFSWLRTRGSAGLNGPVPLKSGLIIGAVQGVCLPFRGFSRSGATISSGLLSGVSRLRAESFSFALALVLTPPVIVREAARLLNAQRTSELDSAALAGLFFPSLVGAALSFASGLFALRWLSSWLERGRWHFFGIYCLSASAAVFGLRLLGY